MGAVLGLVHVMQNLTDPSRLGAGIAIALYPPSMAWFGHLVFLPISGKLKMIILQQVSVREMFIDGLMMIANGEIRATWKTNCKVTSLNHGAPLEKA